MSDYPRISVIMPVFNGLPFIRDAIGSILLQDEPAWELLISDNGSTDGTRDYLRTLQDQSDHRIRIFYQEANIGIFGNLNYLFLNASAEVVQILCADDRLSNSKAISTIIDFWNRVSPDVGAVHWNDRGNLARGLPVKVKARRAQLYFFLFGNLMGNLSTVSCLKTAWKSVGYFNQDYPYVGDFEYWARFSLYWSVVTSPYNIVFVRSHAGQASYYLNTAGEKYKEQAIVLSEIFARIKPSSALGYCLLILTATLIYDSRYRFSLIRAALGGNIQPLKSLNQASIDSKCMLSPLPRDVFFVISLGGRFGNSILVSLSVLLNESRI